MMASHKFDSVVLELFRTIFSWNLTPFKLPFPIALTELTGTFYDAAHTTQLKVNPGQRDNGSWETDF